MTTIVEYFFLMMFAYFCSEVAAHRKCYWINWRNEFKWCDIAMLMAVKKKCIRAEKLKMKHINQHRKLDNSYRESTYLCTSKHESINKQNRELSLVTEKSSETIKCFNQDCMKFFVVFLSEVTKNYFVWKINHWI